MQATSVDSYDVGGQGDFNTVYGNKVLSLKDRLVYSPAENLKFTARAGYYERERDSDVLVMLVGNIVVVPCSRCALHAP